MSKIVIDKFYEDINFVYFVDDSFDINLMDDYAKEFISLYKYITRFEYGNIYVVLKNGKLTSLYGLYQNDENFRMWLFKKFNFVSQEFFII
jgi:hypothetical protein